MCNNIFKGFCVIVLMVVVHHPGRSQGIADSAKRILFLGNSITWAGHYVNWVEAYLRAQQPHRQWEFINAGLPSETVSGLSEPGHADGKFPRPDLHERLARVLQQTQPDLVFACYGMNDGIYLPFDAERFQKFKEGVDWLHREVAKTGARIVHLTPPDYDEVGGKSVGYAAVLDRYADWLMSMKKNAGWEVIDIHYPMKDYLRAHREVDRKFGLQGFALAADGVHPGETGHWLMARQILVYLGYTAVSRVGSVAETLPMVQPVQQYLKLVEQRQNGMRDAWLTATKHIRPGLPVGLPLSEAHEKAAYLLTRVDSILLSPKPSPEKKPDSVMHALWKGYNRTDLVLLGRKCLVIEPKKKAVGNPWIWRMEFFGHEPQADSSLAARGFHVVYMDLQDMYGAPVALKLMDGFYQYLTNTWMLNRKTVLEGFSRGGLFAFNWAARHPGWVSSIYVDAPVCDFKSWPGGKGSSPGSAPDWEKLKKVYGFSSEADAMAYTGNPIDNLTPLAKAGIPILAVCGATDDLVPMTENINIVEERYKKAGGKIKIIVKANNGHHPHSLKDPAPIVDFIVAAAYSKKSF